MLLIENISFDEKYYIGRTSIDAPDIDGLVYIENEKNSLHVLYKWMYNYASYFLVKIPLILKGFHI